MYYYEVSSAFQIIFAKGAHYALEEISKLGYNVIGLDWTVDAKSTRVLLGDKAMQGNMDPVALFGAEVINRFSLL